MGPTRGNAGYRTATFTNMGLREFRRFHEVARRFGFGVDHKLQDSIVEGDWSVR